MHIRVVGVLTACWLMAAIGCGGPVTPTDGGVSQTRSVTGLSACQVRLEGYYYIAAALPTTGPLPIGEGMFRAILQVLDDVNSNGGINGRSVGLVTCDSACDATTASAVVSELAAASPISGIIGTACSGATIPASEIAIREGIVMISPSATSPAITSIADDGWLNRTAPSDALQGVIVSAIAQREGLTDVFVINRDDAYGNGLRQVFIDDFTSVSGNTADFITYDESSPGFATAMVDAAVADAPQATFLISFITDGAAIIQTAIAQAYDPGPWLFPDGLRETGFIEAVADDAFLEGALGTIPASPTGADFTTFIERYRELYATEPGAFNANSYDAAYLLTAAMALSSDPDNRVQVRDSLRNTSSGPAFHPQGWATFVENQSAGRANYEGASGNVDLDENGEPVSNVEEWTVRSGVITPVGCWTPESTPCP